MTPHSPLLDERSLSKLRWRCRRGLLENDLLIERFFDAHLMDLSDNDLLDLLLRRRDPAQLADAKALASATTTEALLVLQQLRPGVAPSAVVH